MHTTMIALSNNSAITPTTTNTGVAPTDTQPPGWTWFNMLRNPEKPDDVICFGCFDGSADELRANAGQNNYAEQLAAVAPYVDSVGTDGLYEIVEEYTT